MVCAVQASSVVVCTVMTMMKRKAPSLLSPFVPSAVSVVCTVRVLGLDTAVRASVLSQWRRS